MLPADFRAHSTARQYFPRCNNATTSVFPQGAREHAEHVVPEHCVLLRVAR